MDQVSRMMQIGGGDLFRVDKVKKNKQCLKNIEKYFFKKKVVRSQRVRRN